MASVAFAAAASVTVAQAEEEGFLGGEVSANVAMVSDYRFRGVSLSDEDFALQGGLDYAHESGFYVGAWSSSLASSNAFGELELDLYAGYAGEIEGISFDIGGLLYAFPTGDHSAQTDYFEAYASVGVDLGVASATVGLAYAFSNDATSNQDNVYIYADVEGEIPDTPVTLTAHLGFEDGAFGNNKLDWSLGASVSYSNLDFGVAYVDTDQAGNNFDAAVIFSIGASF